MQKKYSTLLVLALALAGLPSPAAASGSYTARPPRPPEAKGGTAAIDQDKYALGKKIFAGKIDLKPNRSANAAQQETRLKELAAKLPKPAKDAESLPKLAGKLSAQELASLEYFLAQRYQIK